MNSIISIFLEEKSFYNYLYVHFKTSNKWIAFLKNYPNFFERVFWSIYPNWNVTVILSRSTCPLIITVIRIQLIHQDLFLFELSVSYLCRWLQLTPLISPLALYDRYVFISCWAIEFDASVSKLCTTILPISTTSTFCFQEETRNRKYATTKLMYRQRSWIGWNEARKMKKKKK